MKPYIVVVEDERTELYSFDDLSEAWHYAICQITAGKRAFPAAVLAAPELLKLMVEKKS